MKAYREGVKYSSTYSKFGTKWRWVVNSPPPPRQLCHRDTLSRKLGGPQSRCGLLRKRKIYYTSPDSNPGSCSPSLTIRLTGLAGSSPALTPISIVFFVLSMPLWRPLTVRYIHKYIYLSGHLFISQIIHFNIISTLHIVFPMMHVDVSGLPLETVVTICTTYFKHWQFCILPKQCKVYNVVWNNQWSTPNTPH